MKGHVDLLLLAALRREPLHGYAIVEHVRGASHGALGLAEGTVYPALHRLERTGLLASSWLTANGRRRRVYKLTARGRAQLASEQSDWKTFSRAVEAVLA